MWQTHHLTSNLTVSQHNNHQADLTLPIDIENFVSSLPNLDEYESNPTNTIVTSKYISNIDDFSILSHYDTTTVPHNFDFNRPDSPIRSYLSQIPVANTTTTNNSEFYYTSDINRVDILNCILLNSNINNDSNSTSNYLLTNTSDSFNTVNQQQHLVNDGLFNIDIKQTSSASKRKCSVCGKESSGYHYGSHTCEACKLFFRRTEKRIRKTGFLECQKKNCKITSKSRANCSQCRYKKCIAAGMSMARSRYGRHTERETSSYLPNISESLCFLVEELKTANLNSSTTVELLNEQIVEFYFEALKKLKKSDGCEYEEMNDEAVGGGRGDIKLPMCMIALFCFLFEIRISGNYFVEILVELQNCFGFIKRAILQDNEFVPMLKIGLFLKVLRILFETEPMSKEDAVDKRITDLMRSEFALFKFNSNDSSTLALLLSQLNHVMFKLMSESELNIYVVKRGA